MPPKRKKNDKEDSPPNKKTKSMDGHEDERPAIDVNWAIPKEKRRAIYKVEHVIKYAQLLYQRAQEEINPQQTPLPDPQLRTPVYRSKKAGDLLAENAYKPSASLCNLFNDIKMWSTQEQQSRYHYAQLEQHFNNEDRNIAVVLSRAENNDIFVLNEDQRLDVTVNDVHAHIDIIRRTSSEAGSPMGYFIELPRGMTVTVNGTTYTNSDDLPSTPFYIGPLEGYATIELLSQPVFFFRTGDSLKQQGSNRVVTREEFGRRDRNGDVAVENTTVRWSPLAALPPGTRSGDKEIAGVAEGAEAAGSAKGQRDTAGSTGKEGSKDSEESECDLSDAFTDEGKPIEDSCHYMRARLFSHRSSRYGELIPRVLASVNQGQSDGTGFSYQYQGRDFRPGRTLLVPLEIDENYILLAAQVQPGKQINLRVLDPMVWRTTSDIRASIFKRIKELLSNSKWWQDVFDTSNRITDGLPSDAEWVPAAQVTTGEGSFTYTVLNAWALAMGLEPNPSFTPSLHGHEAFFIQAQQIFDLALQDELTWKVLLAFFQCSKFVNSVHDSEAGGEVESPDKLRLFNLRKRSFQDLITRQTAADTEAEGKKIDIELIALGLKNGKQHRQKFASDSLSERERSELAPIIREGKWNFTDTAEELRRHLKDCAPPAASPPLPPNSYVDTDPVTDEFDPCLYLRTELQKLVDEEKIIKSVESGLEEAVVPTLTFREVNGSIEAVGRAINDLLPPGQGFTLWEYNGDIRYSGGESSGDLDDVVLMLYQKEEEEHFSLVVLQHEKEADYPCAVARVMDSAPWTFTAKERIQLHELIQASGRLKVNTHRGTIKSETILGSVLTWMHGPQQSQTEESGYFAVMNAWAVLLGLPINNDFRSEKAIFQKAFSLIQAVENGYADWKLIWVFLRCVGYTQSTQPPPLERRFRTTRKLNSDERRKIDEERTLRVTEAHHEINYPHFPVDTGLAHTKAFPWDDVDEADRSTRIPEMIKSGKYTKFLSPEIEQAIRGSPVKEKESPCAQFHSRLDEILEKEEIKTELKHFRDTIKPTSNFGGWLQDWELSHAIASVTFAIANFQQDLQQDYLHGFGILTQTQIETMKEGLLVDIRTPRPGRPLIVPLYIQHHFVLLVIQLNDENEPTFSVLDSKAYHLSASDRADVHNWAWRIVVRSNWLTKLFPKNEWKAHRPKYTTWVPVSQQPSDNECGYYTILNGWTVALGLTPDPDANIEWTDQFHNELQDVIHLARIGQADWSLIYNFLRCYGFVLNGEVPDDRRFPQTTALLNEIDIQAEQQVMIMVEDVHFSEEGIEMLDVSQLRNANRIPLYPGGRQHNGVGAFPSDNWSEQVRSLYANNVARNGRLNLDFNSTQLKEAHANLRDVRGLVLRKKLEKDDADYKKQPHDQLLKACQDYLTNWHTSSDLLFRHRPCAILHDTLNLYRYIFQDDFLGKVLSSEAFENTEKWNDALLASDINLAIAAVVAAIDDLQSEKHKNTNNGAPFAGGFSLSTSNDIALAAIQAGAPLSRPRRCWFMPLSLFHGAHLDTINKWRERNKKSIPRSSHNAQGHHILVVVQEQEDEREQEEMLASTTFEMNFYDSAPALLADAVDGPLSKIVAATAKQLQWSQARLEGKTRWTFSQIPAPKQPSGGWQCGPHVVINAWILALGLRPDHRRRYDSAIYQEFHLLARAAVVGLLDWRTLVAWIFCRRLAIDGRMEDVTPDRQFSITDFWPDEEVLADKIRGINEVEVLVTASPEEELPYDRGNNPVHLDDDMLKEIEAQRAAKYRKKDDEGELSRSYDDPDLEFLDHGFLSGSHTKHGIEEVDLAHAKPSKKRQRLGDGLSFLDIY